MCALVYEYSYRIITPELGTSLGTVRGDVGGGTRRSFFIEFFYNLTIISLASFLWDIGKQNSPRCDAAKRGVPSGAILFA